jgi:hypothetical protein
MVLVVAVVARQDLKGPLDLKVLRERWGLLDRRAKKEFRVLQDPWDYPALQDWMGRLGRKDQRVIQEIPVLMGLKVLREQPVPRERQERAVQLDRQE